MAKGRREHAVHSRTRVEKRPRVFCKLCGSSSTLLARWPLHLGIPGTCTDSRTSCCESLQELLRKNVQGTKHYSNQGGIEMGVKAVREACSWRCTALSYIPMQCTYVQCSAVQCRKKSEQNKEAATKRSAQKMGQKWALAHQTTVLAVLIVWGKIVSSRSPRVTRTQTE